VWVWVWVWGEGSESLPLTFKVVKYMLKQTR
jgi:hypothetical protein